MPEYADSLKMYKARKDGSGVASQLDMNVNSKSVFLGMANQDGPIKDNKSKFDWEKQIRFKLGMQDIGEILAVLEGRQDGVGQVHSDTGKHRGLFHQSENGNAVLYFTRGRSTGFYIKLSVRRGEDQRELQHTMTNGEGVILGILLKNAVSAIYNW